MHTILSVIINKIVFYLLFILYCNNAYSNNNILLKEYGYGSLYWRGQKHNKPNIYNLLESNEYIPEGTPVSEIGQNYIITQDENKKLQSIIGISSNLFVKIKGNNVIAEVKFLNNSNKSLYIHKKNIPLSNGKLCDNRFLITTDNIELDYLGGWCNYGAELLTHDWHEIPEKKHTVIQSI